MQQNEEERKNTKAAESFHFTYSAKEQEEIKKIRQKYQPQEEDKMEQLRRMDEGVTKKATIVSLVLGIVGALVMGMGMSLAMTDLALKAGIPESIAMAAGIIIGFAGIIMLCLAYPAYHREVKKEREKIAPEILKLTEELLK